MTTEVVLMSKVEAQGITERIKRSAHDLAELLVVAQEREAWRALGYRSWTAYAESEFDYSRRRIFQLLAEGRVNRTLPEGERVTAREAELISATVALINSSPDAIREAVEQVRAEPVTRASFSDGSARGGADFGYDTGAAVYRCRHCGRQGSIEDLRKCLEVLRDEQDEWGT